MNNGEGMRIRNYLKRRIKDLTLRIITRKRLRRHFHISNMQAQSIGSGIEKKYTVCVNGKKALLKIINDNRFERFEPAYKVFQEGKALPAPFVNPLFFEKYQHYAICLMPWIEGQTLNEVLRLNKVGPDFAEKIVQQISGFHKTVVDLRFFRPVEAYLLEGWHWFEDSGIDCFGYAPGILSCFKQLFPLTSERPMALLHCDLNFENIIIDSKENIFLIDYATLMKGDPLYDWSLFLDESLTKSSVSFRINMVEQLEKKFINTPVWEIMALYRAVRWMHYVGKIKAIPKGLENPALWESMYESLKNPMHFRDKLLGHC